MNHVNPDLQTQNKSGRAVFSEDWLTPWRFALILMLLIAAYFPEVLFAGKAFVFRDFGIFTYPNACFQRECFWRGEFPLWNPLNNTGIPFLAQWNTACLYPFSLIYLLLPLTPGLAVFMLAHLFLAGFGMYLLAAHWTGNRLAAAVAGIAFAFNGLTLNCLMWSSNLGALACMPWVILLVERAWRTGDIRSMVIAGLAGATQMLAGAPEIIAFTWLVLSALWVGHLAGRQAGRGGTFIRFILCGVIAAVLSAAQLLPFLDLLTHSERTASTGTSFWAIPLWGWANLFVPLFHCYQAPIGVYFQPGQDWTSSYYLGIGVLALALAAGVLAPRATRVWLLFCLAISGFVVALGDPGHLYPWLLKLFPPLGFMRYPIKFAFLTVFSLPLLAAFAVTRLCSGEITCVLRPVAAILGLFVVTVLAILWHAHAHPSLYEHWPVLCKNGMGRILFAGLILGGLTCYGSMRNSRRRIMAGILLLTCFWLDVVSSMPGQNPTVEASVFQRGLLSQRMIPMPQPGEARAFMTERSHRLIYGSMLTDPGLDYIGRRCSLFGDCNILDNIPVPDGFYSLYLLEQRSLFIRFFASPTNAFPSGFADFLGISQISSPENALAWQFRPSYLPFCFIGAKPEFVELSNTPALLLAKDFDPRKTVYLPVETQAGIKDVGVAHGQVHQTHWMGQALDLAVEADAPAMFVL